MFGWFKKNTEESKSDSNVDSKSYVAMEHRSVPKTPEEKRPDLYIVKVVFKNHDTVDFRFEGINIEEAEAKARVVFNNLNTSLNNRDITFIYNNVNIVMSDVQRIHIYKFNHVYFW